MALQEFEPLPQHVIGHVIGHPIRRIGPQSCQARLLPRHAADHVRAPFDESQGVHRTETPDPGTFPCVKRLAEAREKSENNALIHAGVKRPNLEV